MEESKLSPVGFLIKKKLIFELWSRYFKVQAHSGVLNGLVQVGLSEELCREGTPLSQSCSLLIYRTDFLLNINRIVTIKSPEAPSRTEATPELLKTQNTGAVYQVYI